MIQNLGVKKRKTENTPSRPIETGDGEFEKLFSNSRILTGKCDASKDRLQPAVLEDLKTLSAKFD